MFKQLVILLQARHTEAFQLCVAALASPEGTVIERRKNQFSGR